MYMMFVACNTHSLEGVALLRLALSFIHKIQSYQGLVIRQTLVELSLSLVPEIPRCPQEVTLSSKRDRTRRGVTIAPWP